MADDVANADAIIDEIDDGALRPTTHLVVRALHRHMRLEAVQQKALAAFDRGDQPADMAVFRDNIWATMERRPLEEQGGLRLSNCLTRPDEVVDWHLAEYLIDWARQQELTDQQIIEAFHVGSTATNQ